MDTAASCRLRGGLPELEKFMDTLKIISLAASLGQRSDVGRVSGSNDPWYALPGDKGNDGHHWLADPPLSGYRKHRRFDCELGAGNKGRLLVNGEFSRNLMCPHWIPGIRNKRFQSQYYVCDFHVLGRQLRYLNAQNHIQSIHGS